MHHANSAWSSSTGRAHVEQLSDVCFDHYHEGSAGKLCSQGGSVTTTFFSLFVRAQKPLTWVCGTQACRGQNTAQTLVGTSGDMTAMMGTLHRSRTHVLSHRTQSSVRASALEPHFCWTRYSLSGVGRVTVFCALLVAVVFGGRRFGTYFSAFCVGAGTFRRGEVFPAETPTRQQMRKIRRPLLKTESLQNVHHHLGNSTLRVKLTIIDQKFLDADGVNQRFSESDH